MKKILSLISLLLLTAAWSQNFPMTAANNGQTFNTCSGTFTDDGGSTGNYSNNINNRTITFCPDNPDDLIKFNFTSFHTENNYDKLDVFYGPAAEGTPAMVLTGNLGAFSIISAIPGDCITFRFTSDFSLNYSGWVANISCVTPCTPPTAALVDDSNVDICSAEAENGGDLTVQFDASNSVSNDGSPIVKYIWNWGDGTTTTTTTPVTTHTFPNEPGYYTVTLKVRTNNTGTDPEGCLSSNVAVRYIRVLPPPNFTGTTTGPININCGDSVDLVGIGGSQTITQSPPLGSGTDVPLPDTQNYPFDSTIDLTGFFPPGAKVTASCLPNVTFNIEHSFAGDLKIILIAPSGEQVILMDGYSTGPSSSNNLGSVKLGYCVNGGEGTGPGCFAPYHIVNSGGYNWLDANSRTTFTQSCTTYNGPCESGNYFKQNENFNSSQPLTNLVGAELNGIWTLRIVDYWAIDDGYLDSWSISFNGSCYIDLETETPILSGGDWTHDGNGPEVPTTQNIINEPIIPTGIDPCPGEADCTGNQLSNTITVGPFNQAGTYTYTFTVTDEFGCSFERNVDVIVAGIETEFAPLPNQFCLNQTPDPLPEISDNGVHGTWSPSNVIDTSVPGTFTYTFTPDEGVCGTIYTIQVTIADLLPTSFNLVNEYCQGSPAENLPTTSIQGHTGTWTPAVIDTSVPGVFTYTFTPDDPCVAPFEIEIEVDEQIMPTFPEIAPICQNTVPPVLNNISDNGISGTWFPATIDTSTMGTFIFTFTPDAQFCASEKQIEIVITEELPVVFDLPNSYCQGETPVVLPTTLPNGLTGTWVPAVVDTNAVGTSIYTFYPDEGQCALETPMTVEIYPELELNNAVPTQFICDDDFDGVYEFNLTSLNAMLSNVAGVTYQYYASETDYNNNNPIPSYQWNNYQLPNTLPVTIWIVGVSPNGCPSEPVQVQIDARDVASHNPGPFGPIEYCFNETVDLTQFEPVISNADVTFNYYYSLQSAQNQTNAIQNLTEFVPTSNVVIVRVDQDGRCPAFVEIQLEQLPTPSLELSQNTIILCYEDEAEVTATSDNPLATFTWTFPDGTVMVGPTQLVSDAGTYTVVATSPDNCNSVAKTLTVALPSQPVITGIDMTNNTITVHATNNGEGPMEYSLDQIFWQSTPQFINLIPGEEYTVYVRSSGCMIASYKVTLIYVPNFISPNNDGKNDTWTIRGVESSPGSTIKIFDRYGKIFVDTTFDGNYEWDGRYLGRNVPSGDYWYIINIPGDAMVKPQKFVGHITVRNR